MSKKRFLQSLFIIIIKVSISIITKNAILASAPENRTAIRPSNLLNCYSRSLTLSKTIYVRKYTTNNAVRV